MLPIKNCRKCYLLHPRNNSFLCQANVEFSGDEEITLSFTDWNPRKKSICGQAVLFYDSVNGLVTCTCDLLDIRPDPEKKGYHKALCRIQSIQDLVNRHEDFRLSISLSIRVTYSDAQGKKPVTVDGITTNLSAGGLYFITAEPLPVPSFQIRFYHNILPFVFQARVLRKNELGNKRFGYGCCFENLSSNAESMLRGYIFQMESRHKN